MADFRTGSTAALLLLALALRATPALAVEDACDLSADEERALLALDYRAFDQGLEPLSGWRPFWEKGCYAEVARFIHAYRAKSEANAKIEMLAFHEGQALAAVGDYRAAIEMFKLNINEKPSKRLVTDWNSYVQGTIAFLERDREALLAARDRLRLQKPWSDEALKSISEEYAKDLRGTKPNLPVLDGFLNCFERPYAEAYGAACRAGGQKATPE